MKMIDLDQVDVRSIGRRTKVELVQILKAMKERNLELAKENFILKAENQTRLGEWIEKDGAIRCSVCGNKAPRARNAFGILETWLVPYCMMCGRKMKNGERS